MMKHKIMIALWACTLNLVAQNTTTKQQRLEFLESNFKPNHSKLPDSLVLTSISNISLQEKIPTEKKEETSDKIKPFIAYEFGEMAFNKFQNFSGEVGITFKSNNLLRFVYQNVKLSEKHLSSNFAKTVDGKNIRGLMKSYELFYDHNVYNISLTSKIYFGLSTGYTNDYYEHTILDLSVENTSWTIGFAPSFRETNLFKIKGLYINLAVPFRYYFNPLEETRFEDSTIKRHLFVNNIWCFIGYQF